jgi:hypothetical protein
LSFAARAIALDGQNLFTTARREEIRARMERTKSLSIIYQSINYSRSNLCAVTMGYPYEFPCARLSPMDFFDGSWMTKDLTRFCSRTKKLQQKPVIIARKYFAHFLVALLS